MSCLISAFPKLNIFPLAFFALAPFVIILRNINPGKGFWYAYIYGLIFSAYIFAWIYPVTLEGWILSACFYALPFGLFGFIAAYFYKITKSEDYWKRLLFIPSLYILIAEYLKSLPPLGLPCGILASSQYKFLPMLQIADIFGILGVSWVIMFFNVYLAEMIMMRAEKPFSAGKNFMKIIIPPLVVIFCLLYGFYKLDSNYKTSAPLKISIVQPNIDQNIKWDKGYFDQTLLKLFTLTREAAGENPNLIIWPETALPAVLLQDRNLSDIMKNFVDNMRINLLSGSLDYYDDKLYNSAFLIMPDKFIVSKYDKMHLFPMGEYNPLEKILPHFKALNRVGKYNSGKNQTVFEVNGRKFSVLICLESIFSYLSRDAVVRGAQFLVTITNDAWFGKTSAAEQHIALSQARAIENRVYMVFAANTGYSAFIDPCGRIYKISGLFKDAVLTDNIYTTGKRSIFTRFREWFIAVCAIVVVIFLAAETWRRRKK